MGYVEFGLEDSYTTINAKLGVEPVANRCPAPLESWHRARPGPEEIKRRSPRYSAD